LGAYEDIYMTEVNALPELIVYFFYAAAFVHSLIVFFVRRIILQKDRPLDLPFTRI
jgi:hypothetical protein